MSRDEDIFKIRHNDRAPEKGTILIAEPFMRHVFFQRAVVLLVEHGAKGSMGFILNKRTDVLLNDFFTELENVPDIPIFLGGPVHPNQLYFIHSLEQDIFPCGMKINEQLYLDGNFEELKSYLSRGNPTEGKVKFFLGYSGWESSQLDDEISADSWLVSRSSHKSILLADNDSYWNRTVERLGPPYSAWTKFPKNPEMN
ncbi:MAG: YqgE/AlgH family protein [Tannerella sp.]|jgi:putative transcriptional regulator|nr:YqgE/AlgH family protein [Tannerella sp.]